MSLHTTQNQEEFERLTENCTISVPYRALIDGFTQMPGETIADAMLRAAKERLGSDEVTIWQTVRVPAESPLTAAFKEQH